LVAIVKDIRGRVAGLDANSRLLATRGFGIGGTENNIGANTGKHRAFGSYETVALWDDFVGKTLSDENWTALEGTDTGTADQAIVASLTNGVLRLTAGDSTGSVAADGSQIVSERQWRADAGNLIYEARFKLASVASVSCFLGFTDSTSLEAPIHSAASANTITTNATDAVGIFFDTSMGTDDWWLAGVKGDTDATHQDALVAPSADTYETWRIEVSTTGSASFYRNGAAIGTAVADAVTATVLLTPTAIIWPRSAAAGKIMDIDYIHVAQDRV
jgi:hypothetical protein